MNELDVFICRMSHVFTVIVVKILAGGEALYLQLLWDHHSMGQVKGKKMRIEDYFLFFFSSCQVSFPRASYIHRSMYPSPVPPSNQKWSEVGFRLDKERTTEDFSRRYNPAACQVK